MKQDLTVHPISLKSILENMDRIPERTGKFGEPSNDLSKEEKKKLYEFMRKFNKYGHALRGDQAIMETAKALSEMSAMAKKYAMNEHNADFIQRETVERDYKQLDNITKQFKKLAKECVNRNMQLAALFEDAGNIYERYFEMEAINETGNVDPQVETSLPMSESGATSECSSCGCGDPNRMHGKSDVENLPTVPDEQEEYASGFEENALNEGTCRDCGGSGKCRHCHGNGQVRTY